jgi:hypothetical protein
VGHGYTGNDLVASLHMTLILVSIMPGSENRGRIWFDFKYHLISISYIDMAI